jgi:hypothetical protein
MKKLIIIFLIAAHLGCSNDKEEMNSLPYFKFQQTDSDKFIDDAETGKVLIYKNQDNAELRFKVLSNSTEKRLEDRGDFVYGATKYFYYDEQRIEMQSTLFAEGDFCCDSSFSLSLKRWPIVYETNPDAISEDSEFIANIGLVPFQTGIQSIFLDYSQPVLDMAINGVTYHKVRKIEITPNPFPNPSWQLPSLRYIYFDQNKGVIGFDDLQNNEWRLQN